MQSQESAPLEESSQPINTQTDEKMSDASGEFNQFDRDKDRKPEKDVNKTKKPKGKRKTAAKHEDSQQHQQISQDSVIRDRVGDNNNNTEMMLGEHKLGRRRPCPCRRRPLSSIREQEEEDAILVLERWRAREFLITGSR